VSDLLDNTVRGRRSAENTNWKKLREVYPIIGDVRGKGLLLAFELVSDRETMRPAAEGGERISGVWWNLPMNGALILLRAPLAERRGRRSLPGLSADDHHKGADRRSPAGAERQPGRVGQRFTFVSVITLRRQPRAKKAGHPFRVTGL